MTGLFSFFKSKARLPLNRKPDITPELSALAAEDPAQALDDITHGLIQLVSESKLNLKDRARKLTWLDQAAQHFERQLRHEYIAASRLPKRIEERLWTASTEFLEATIHAHLHCIAALRCQQPPTAQGDIAPIAIRALCRLDNRALWSYLRYEPIPTDIWEQLSFLIRLGEESQLMDRPGMLNSATLTQTCMKRELLKFLMLSVSAPERLTKTQIDLAHRLTQCLAEGFIWQDTPGPSTLFQVDASAPALPARWTNNAEHHFRFRGFGPGAAFTTLLAWLNQLALGTIPQILVLPDPALYRREDLWEVLTHLSQCWRRTHPGQEPSHLAQYGNTRRPQFSRISIVHDFNSLHDQLPQCQANVPMAKSTTIDSGPYGFNTTKTDASVRRMPTTRTLQPENSAHSETWVVERISKMGYSATLAQLNNEDWLKPNVIIGIKPVAADWQIGIVRRLNSESLEHTAVGIQLLSNQPKAAMLRLIGAEPRMLDTSADTQRYHVPAILLAREMTLQHQDCLLLAPESYELHHTYEMVSGGFKRIVRLIDRVQRYHGLDKVMFEDISSLPTDALSSIFG